MSAMIDPGGAFRHEALLYAGWADFIVSTVPFIREGLKAGEPILVVVSAEKTAALRIALDGDADRVLFADMAEIGANPARIIPAWQAFVRDHGQTGTRLRGIGEPIWKGRPDDELTECQRHESLLNVAFASGQPWWLLCPYDTEQLDPAVVDEARKSHEFVSEAGASGLSQEFRGVQACSSPFSQPLAELGDEVEEVTFGKSELSTAREMTLRHAGAARLLDPRASDLVAAVNEVATNALIHGGGKGRLRIWHSRTKLICEVCDAGVFDQPLADRQEPGPEISAPRGLWLANQLVDLVQIRTFPEGTTVRLHMRVDSTEYPYVMQMPGLTQS
jgi:anti-sigma regulatory factor (Ser/Thr protein kinase)